MPFEPITSYVQEVAPLFQHECIMNECREVDECQNRQNKLNLLDMMIGACDLSSPLNKERKRAYQRVLIDI